MTASTNRIRVNNSGNTIIPGGICLGTADADTYSAANNLDDYETGTWSPVITGYGGGNTATFNIREGFYTKLGDLVIAYFSVALSSKGNISGSYTLITNIPFNNTAGGTRWGSGYITRFGGLNNTRYDLGVEMGGTSTSYGWVTQGGGSSTGYLNTSDVSNTTFFEGVLIYNTTA